MKFKGKSSPKQCLPQNPVKKGYKVLFDKSEYVWKFEVYTRSRKGVVGERVARTFGWNMCGKDPRL